MLILLGKGGIAGEHIPYVRTDIIAKFKDTRIRNAVNDERPLLHLLYQPGLGQYREMSGYVGLRTGEHTYKFLNRFAFRFYRPQYFQAGGIAQRLKTIDNQIQGRIR